MLQETVSHPCTRALVAFPALLGACHATEMLAPAPVEGAGTLLLMAYVDSGLGGVYALDPADSDHVSQYPQLAYRDDVTLYAVTYECPPDALDLKLGAQKMRDTPREGSPLPPESGITRSAVRDGQQGEWEILEDLSGEVRSDLNRLDLGRNSLCRLYATQYSQEFITLDLDPYSPATFVVPLNDRELFFGTLDGRFFRVNVEDKSTVRLTTLSTTTPHHAAFKASEREIWLFGNDGRVIVGHPDDGFVPSAPSGVTGSQVFRVAAAQPGVPLELFLISDTGSLVHYNGRSWQELVRRSILPRPVECTFLNGPGPVPPSVAWIAPGEAIALGAADRLAAILRYQDGSIARENLEGASPDLSFVSNIEGIGQTIGTCGGQFVRRTGETWALDNRGGAPDGPVYGAAKTGRSVIYGTLVVTLSYLAQYHPIAGYCAVEEVGQTPVHMVRMSEDTLVVGNIDWPIQKVCRELAQRDLLVKPHFYFSDEWFSPDGIPGVAVPFYLAHPRLMRLERSQILEVEGGTYRECLRLLRHEVGHVVDHAFRLRRRREWQRTFGKNSRRYPTHYRPNPTSKRFVLHLDHWYAQSHPSEDFAETFAVWLRPGSPWRKRYAGWPALKKLRYVQALMAIVANEKPLVRSRARPESLPRLRSTLREYYEEKRSHYLVNTPTVYDQDLRRIFTDDPGRRKSETAAAFLRRNRREIRQMVARWTGEYEFTLDQVLKEMIARCIELKLRAVGRDRQLSVDFAILLTAKTMHHLYSERYWIPL